jgi:hypothetical protein
MPSQALL